MTVDGTKLSTKKGVLHILIEEPAGISRVNEPVTMGLPFVKGCLMKESSLYLIGRLGEKLPLQVKVLARWGDDSLKWVLLDFQISAEANAKNKLQLFWEENQNDASNKVAIKTKTVGDTFVVDTSAATFFLNTKKFFPFDRAIVEAKNILAEGKSKVVLTDDRGIEYIPTINSFFCEEKGDLRTTLYVEGEFKSDRGNTFSAFFSRISFFAHKTFVKLDFTILNPKRAMHPGGLWDLGDPGSIFFKDLSIHTTMNSSEECRVLQWQTGLNREIMKKKVLPSPPMEDDSVGESQTSDFTIYQDSSGGDNWKSCNHVNRNGEVKNTFKGYRVFYKGELIEEGSRADPVLILSDGEKALSGAVQSFWQNFPKAIESKGNTLTIRLFPSQYNDLFELQGGEQKTHTVFLDFSAETKGERREVWLQKPLIARCLPQWYAESGAFPYLLPQEKNEDERFLGLIRTAIEGNNTFFDRREVIDEYGWRNFGEFYADHEAVSQKGSETFVSHYNNQYDGIYGTLMQYVGSGDFRWFLLSDQLCRHVKDIDIYHTDEDRPEYNKGLFWHTEHYIAASTATHRCFSKNHLSDRNKSLYGGGPSLSHNYSTGFLMHYYLTGDRSSLSAVEGLLSFVESNIEIENTLGQGALKRVKRLLGSFRNMKNKNLVEVNKVYGLDGPGRASGNVLNTLIDGYAITNKKQYLQGAEALIRSSIHPDDDIKKRDLLDVENRWMYVVFFQAVGKYLDLKSEKSQYDDMFYFVKQSLANYATWMLEHETPYLDNPENLEFPNETWAAQEIRKCNVLLYAAKYTESPLMEQFLSKAKFFYREGLDRLLQFETKTLTRPIVLMLLNGMMFNDVRHDSKGDLSASICQNTFDAEMPSSPPSVGFLHSLTNAPVKRSLKREIEFIKWRLGRK